MEISWRMIKKSSAIGCARRGRERKSTKSRRIRRLERSLNGSLAPCSIYVNIYIYVYVYPRGRREGGGGLLISAELKAEISLAF